MKAISEFKYSVQNPIGEELLIVNQQQGSGHKSYKVKLSDLKAFIEGGRKYTMTFDANGGTGGWYRELVVGTPITPPSVVREGYEFVEWSPTPPETMPAHDVACIAQWQRPQYTVSFDKRGGSGGTDSVVVEYGETMPAITAPTRNGGYQFLGYFSETNGRGNKYYDSDGDSAGICDFQQDTTLYAHWNNRIWTDVNVHVEIGSSAGYEHGQHVSGTVSVIQDNVAIGQADYSGNYSYGFNTDLTITIWKTLDGGRLTLECSNVYPARFSPTVTFI